MRWFFVMLAATSFLSGACGAQAASCTYGNVCAGTNVAGVPTYKMDCVYADNVKMVSTVEIFNDNYGPLTAVRIAVREICYDDKSPQNPVFDSNQWSGTITCDANSSCATITTVLTLTAQSTTNTCPCHTTDKYQTTFWVGDHWDATYGYHWIEKTSAFTTAP